MPIHKVPDTDLSYYLVSYDENGEERPEDDGKFLSQAVIERAAANCSDVFFLSHGWKGDIPAAIEQYDKWIGAMAALEADRAAARRADPNFAPLIVGLHWPSLPWGDEEMPKATGGAVLSATDDIQTQVDFYAAKIADTKIARDAIKLIFEAARANPEATALTADVRSAYTTLFRESGLQTGATNGAPGADQDAFDPDVVVKQASEGALQIPALRVPGVLSFGEKLRDIVLAPLRQISFWKMKNRARVFGENGGHRLLSQLQSTAPSARFHLMGHSFGCIVASAAVAGAPDGEPLPRPVDTLFLVQGALSLWSFAARIPYANQPAGYFHSIIERGLVNGPILTTRSIHDTAVGRYYPLGAEVRKQFLLAEEYPKYGGVGAFGIRGIPSAREVILQPQTTQYAFRPRALYNIEASRIISQGGGASGAHSDIAHPEVAHAFWQAVMSGLSQKNRTRDLGAVLAKSENFESTTRSRGAIRGGGGLLGGSDVSAHRRVNEGQKRWVNAELENNPPNQAIVLNKWYTLAVDVDVEARGGATAVDFNGGNLFSADEEEVLLVVELDSTVFKIDSAIQTLRVPKAGPSLTKARFNISPQQNGPSTLKATIHKDGNFIQQMSITFNVGSAVDASVRVSAKGRSTAAAGILSPRELSIVISKAERGYDCKFVGSVSSNALLPIDSLLLNNVIDSVRRQLMEVVTYQNPTSGELVFQQYIDIEDEADRKFALRTMARAGAQLFNQLFFGYAAGPDSIALGNLLRTLATRPERHLNLQIVAERTPLPWGMLYVGDVSDDSQLSWDNFLGMRHVIEQIPLQNNNPVEDSDIPSMPNLSVSLNLNTLIDEQLGGPFVSQQQAFWSKATTARSQLQLVSRLKCDDVYQALGSKDTPDQILYFYCHAESQGLAENSGPEDSCIELSDGVIKLRDLSLNAPTRIPLAGKPLVFINACESAELSPLFYDGFVPYFMAKGARGVVGTECKTPALFAVEWANRFFEKFFTGKSLGEVFLGLRREFLATHHNPLGLLYAVYCDGDTVIKPAI